MLVFCSAVEANTLARSIVVTGHPNYPPFSWMEGDTMRGASVDLVTTIFAEKNIAVEAKPFGPWVRVQRAAQNSEFDLLLGVLKTKDREQYLIFLDEFYAIDPIAIFIHQQTYDILELNDLHSKRGVANRGESFGHDFDMFVNAKLQLARVTEVDQAFLMLVRKRIDYVVHGYYPSLVMMQKLKIDNVKSLRSFVASPEAYQAFTSKSEYKALAPWLSARVKHYREQGVVDKLIAENLKLWRKTH